MSFGSEDLGDLNSLAKAMGLVDAGGDFQDDWLTKPDHYLARMLAEDHQRDALMTFIDDMLGGSIRRADVSGRIWLPIVEIDDPNLDFFLVIDDSPTSHVRIGVGVSVKTTNPDSETGLHVPLFKTAKTGHSVSDVILLGTAEGAITFSTDILIDQAAPVPGQAHLGSIGLALDVPTSGSQPPDIIITLGTLQLPGAQSPRDITVASNSLDTLDDMALELVLGLIEAQAAGLPAGPLTALAGLLGLRDGIGIPELPISDFANIGVSALATWLDQVVSDAAARSAWFSQWADLLGGSATSAGVTLPLGPASITLALDVVTGAAGLSQLTPRLSAKIATGSLKAELAADLAVIELGSGNAIALPKVSLSVHAGDTGDGGTPLLTGDPAVAGFRFGIALDGLRKPVLVLAADGVTIGTNTYATLDLSTPDALVDGVGTILGDVIDDLIAQLGPIGDTLRVLFGLSKPAGHPTVPTLDFAAFIADPLGTLRAHWQVVLKDHQAAMPDLLESLRGLLGDAAEAVTPVSGSGTVADPWKLPLVGPVHLRLYGEPAGEKLTIAIGASYAVDTLGDRCTRVETEFSIALFELDLLAGAAIVAADIRVSFKARARGHTRARFAAGPIALSADHIGLSAQWQPGRGVRIEALAPNPTAEFRGQDIPIALPVFDANGIPQLTPEQWDGVERLLGLLGAQSSIVALNDLVNAFGWVSRGPNLADDPSLYGLPRLRLADILANPANAIENWARDLLTRQASSIEDLMVVISRLLTGTHCSIGRLLGAGRPDLPYRLPLLGDDLGPSLAFWLEPHGPGLDIVTNVGDAIRDWQPGNTGLQPSALAEALINESPLSTSLQTMLQGRNDIAAGLQALLERWIGTDGLIVPPVEAPAGVLVHRFDDVLSNRLGAQVDVSELISATPDVRVFVEVVAVDEAFPWTGVPADRLLDLRAPGLLPESFTAPDAAAGDWFIALGERAATQLETDDLDGVTGQRQRLEQVLSVFGGLGRVVLIAGAGAGHAARQVAETVNAITDVVTLGMPLGPVAFSILDSAPGAEALRVLLALLPDIDNDEPDDADLATGRDLLGMFEKLLAKGDPGVELRPPAVPHPAPRAGLGVHAVFGLLSSQVIDRALTAIVSTGLSARAVTRAAQQTAVEASGTGVGVSLPFKVRGDGLVASGTATLETLGFDLLAAGGPKVRTGKTLKIALSLAAESGWLVGGPDPERGPGPRAEHELRSIQASIAVPLTAGGQAQAEIVLVEPKVFDITRERWVVSAAGVESLAADVVTPALPEVRVLLSQVASRLNDATSAEMATLKSLMSGLGLLDDAGGMVADAIEHLINEPAQHVTDSLTNALNRTKLQTAINDLVLQVPGLSIDLATRSLDLTLSGVPGSKGLLPWQISLGVSAGSAPQFSFELQAASGAIAGGVGIRLGNDPFAIELVRERPGVTEANSSQVIPLWPNPDGDALLGMVSRMAPAELARVGLSYLRDLDELAQPIVDAIYDAFGLLNAVGVNGERSVKIPLELLENPVGWLGHAGALGDGTSGAFSIAPAKVIALMDAFKPILGVAGGAGVWPLANGVQIKADSPGGDLRLALSLDTSGFAQVPTAAGRLLVSGDVTLTLPNGTAPQPGIALSVGLEGASPGRQALHVELNGGLKLFLRPASGPDISIYPDPPGLGSITSAAVTQALPLLLDALTDETPPGLAAQVGAVVAEIGDAMALRSGAPARFDGAALETWASDPAGALAAALPGLTTAALNALVTAIGPLLPAPVNASLIAGVITVDVGGFSLGLQTAPFAVAVGVDVSPIPGAGKLTCDATFSNSGLDSLFARVGPGDIDAGGLTIRPYVDIAVGNAPVGGRSIGIGLAFDADRIRGVEGRWLIDSSSFTLYAIDGVSEHTDPDKIALALIEAVVQLLGQFTLSAPAVTQLLDKQLPAPGNKKVRSLLKGVFLENTVAANAFDPLLFQDMFQLVPMLNRLKQLLKNVAGAGIDINVGGGLTVGMNVSGTNIVQLTLGINGRIDLSSDDIVISLEADSRWIKDTPAAGLSLGFLNATTDDFAPSIAVDGLGVRFARNGAPLLEAGISLGSIALHVLGRVSATELTGGVQVQFSDLAVGVSGASGGNPVAQGMVADAGSGNEQLAPGFSPALAIQKHGSDPLLFSLRAGDGDGPWWLPIQKGFGPIYIEQIGLDTTVANDKLIDISLLLDGGVSISGLAASVDDLRLTFVVSSDASIFDPSRWSVDLAGLAIEADMAGISLAGGLRKFGGGDTVEYIGMLMARFATYGISIYGGYGTGVDNGEKFTAFFAFGAINGPIGGPPAFFLTGIGGGIGINRDLIIPTELNNFDEFIFIRALDPSASSTGDPMQELIELRDTFPMKRGDFWFAAGISFNSFALVDGIAVVAVKIGDGFELSLLGLARLALPRPEIALVSIELGLIVRFSTKEGVLWIQAQLTDNSWLLHESVRLTGGFAFVSWFDGPRAGEFVLSMGGFHPSFHRDGYPVVPRLGFNWQVASAIVIKGENYFALTSEALMVGGKLEASAKFGPAWAEVKFGADGIVYFDPFRFEVEVYARIAAGITIDVWIGEITISISLGARIKVEGPKFRGVATFEVGPIELTVEFGDTQKAEKVYLTWNQFVPKYLEETSPGVARCVTALTGKGTLPPGPGEGSAEGGTADGSLEKPFEVLSEFEFNVTTLVPTQAVKVGIHATIGHAPSRDIGIAPIGDSSAYTILVLRLRDSDDDEHLHVLNYQVHRADGFPVGVWGNPQEDDDRKVPKGEVIEAVDGLYFEAVAEIEDSLPQEMAYHQIESGPRKPLPFILARDERTRFVADAAALVGVVPDVASVAQMYAEAKPWMAIGGHGKTSLAALQRDRQAPPRLGSLAENIAAEEPDGPVIDLPPGVVKPPIDATVRAPHAIAVLTAEVAQEIPSIRTTVSDAGRLVATAPPRFAEIEAAFDWAVPAKLIRAATPAAVSQETVVASTTVPFSRGQSQGLGAVATRGASFASQQRLMAINEQLGSVKDFSNERSVRCLAPFANAQANAGPRIATQTTLSAGEVAVLRLPNAERDVDVDAPRPRLSATGGPARLLAMASGGRILSDSAIDKAGVAIPKGTERLIVLAKGTPPDRNHAAPGLHGWHDGQALAYIGWGSALLNGGCLCAEGSSAGKTRQRFRAGWIPAAQLIEGAPLVVTRFNVAIRTVMILIDDARIDDAEKNNLALGLKGADRAIGPDGLPLPPVLVSMGNRSLLVYELQAQKGKQQPDIAVSIARQAGFRIAGVMASARAADSVVNQIENYSFDQLVQPLAPGPGAAVKLKWTPQPRPVEPGRSSGSNTRKKSKKKTKKKTSRKATATKRLKRKAG